MTDHTENIGKPVHSYAVSCSWQGSTGTGYELYDRTHEVLAMPTRKSLSVSADPAFRGDPKELNPEQLVVMAAASCQLLSFLAVAARARVDIVGYTDEAEGIMPEDDLPVRITEIRLRPRIVVSGSVSDERILHLVEVAHKACYIANSLNSRILVEASVERVLDDSSSD